MRVLVAVVVGLGMVAGPGAALASPPANDNFVAAMPIPSLPFTDSGDLGGTTTEPGEQSFCVFQEETVWYSFTPSTNTVIQVDPSGSFGPVAVTAYRQDGSGLGGLTDPVCSFGSPVTFAAAANTTYYVQVGTFFSGPLHIQLSFLEIPPPPNDDFVDAKPIGSLAYVDSLDLRAATTETNEPVTPAGQPITGSAWYAFTATGSNPLTASTGFCCPGPTLAVYTGSQVDGLTAVASTPGSLLTFRPTAGTTYYFQVGRVGSSFVTTSFNLDLAPPPSADFSFNPFDPSVFDAVQFFGFPSDPGGVGIATLAWDFGDGSTTTGNFVGHQYAGDGDYTVTFTVTTLDGRTGSSSQLLHVRTHDVAIMKFSAPNAASAGQTRQLTVGLSNGRYPETVQVELRKSVPGSGGFQTVGVLTQFVPVGSRNKTVNFSFSYTFTADDRLAGKVTFQAVAAIISGARDAQPADNTAIAPVTKVSR
jgi:hypothetical protein